ncbi:LysM peptidoglycan-binding domain-containing protein [Marispirochaeta aestuarii]|uniref:LysM peptidoglycan-binding domain-containing protein n=1 Tax=Marispirochaeta aestuarii TaxID=1963862 RepID=UPI0029C88BEA|nr:LysM peptidoglycan-binding domain-containing protein [Marispirochaeta aestuarii]
MDKSRLSGGNVTLCILLCMTFHLYSGPLPARVEHWKGASKIMLSYETLPPSDLFNREGAPLPTRQGHKGPAFQSLNVSDFEDNPEVKAHYLHYSGKTGQEYLDRVLRRGEPYLPFIYSKIRQMGLPWELAYLPIIESAFIPSALSRSGASGLWQFMLNSIHPYDIQVNRWLDERRDFWKSTTGALEKLKSNYDVLGDWLLAIGAYNCGLGCMQRALEAAGTRDFWTLARNGYLPAETVSYVPRFLAVSRFASYPGRYRLPLQWEDHLWTRVEVSGPVHLSRLAEAADIPLRILAEANQELNQPVTPPQIKGYRLKVPQEYADSITRALNDEELALMDLDTYTIQQGDTLYALSRHYGVSTDLLLEFNPRLDPRRLMIGSEVIIPLAAPMPPYAGPEDNAGIVQYNTVTQYKVQPGDTLSSIGRRYNTSAAELAYNNQLSLNSLIHPGMVLKVPLGESAPEEKR